jgi:hypothetical protein
MYDNFYVDSQFVGGGDHQRTSPQAPRSASATLRGIVRATIKRLSYPSGVRLGFVREAWSLVARF